MTINLSTTGDNTIGPSAFAINSEIEITAFDVANVTLKATNQRLFYVAPGGSLTLTSLTLADSRSVGGSGADGGGGGAAGMGGAIFNEGSLSLQNSILSGNTALGGNGGNGTNTGGGGVGGGRAGGAGGRAGGGLVDPGTYLVGERGPELLSVGASGNVITNENLQKLLNRLAGDSDNNYIAAALEELNKTMRNIENHSASTADYSRRTVGAIAQIGGDIMPAI